MKSVKIAAWLLLSSTALVYAQKVTVKGNSKLNTDFSNYKTYSWATADETLPGASGYEIYSYELTPQNTTAAETSKKPAAVTGKKKATTVKTPTYIYSYRVIIPAVDTAANATIQNSIAEELGGRGYHNDDLNPDLLVAYKVLTKKGKIRGYKSDYPELAGRTEVHTPEDTVTYFIKPGTLMVDLIDTKSSQIVWNGFASGLVKGNVFVADPVKLEEAIHLIFEQFKYRADKIDAMK